MNLIDNSYTQVINALSSAIAGAGEIFSRFIGTGKFLKLFMAVFFIFTIYRLLLVPLFGVSASDGVIGEDQKEQAREENYKKNQALKDKYKKPKGEDK